MADKKINEFTEEATPGTGWFVLADDGNGNYYKIQLGNLPGGGGGGGGGTTQLDTPGSFEVTITGPTTANAVWADVANESSYQLQQSPASAGTWTTIATPAADATSQAITGLTASTAYDWRLKAVGDGVTYTDSNYATDTGTTSGSLEAVVWTDATANITTGSNGAIATTSAGINIGARATKKLTGSFTIEAQFKTPYSNSELAGIWLSDVNNTTFDTGSGSNTGIIGGFAVYTDDVYRYTGPDTQGSNSAIILTDGAADGMWVRIERSGDDLLYYTSPDGTTYTLRYTDTGAFTGLTECFIKFMNSGGTNVGYDQVRGQGLTTI